MKTLKKVLILAASSIVSSSAFSMMDFEGSIRGDLYNFSRSVSSAVVTDAKTDKTTVSTSGFLKDLGVRLSGYYQVSEDVYFGLSTGVDYLLAFSGTVSKQVGDAAATDVKVEDDKTLAEASSYLVIPVKVGIKWDLATFASDINVYLTPRAGIGFAFNMGDEIAEYKSSMLSGLFDFAFGVEFWGAQLEFAYEGKFLGGFYKEAAKEGSFDTKTYSHHALGVGLGYRFTAF